MHGYPEGFAMLHGIRRPDFTFMELLVMHKVRAVANRAQCPSNLRQIGWAVHQYMIVTAASFSCTTLLARTLPPASGVGGLTRAWKSADSIPAVALPSR